MSNTALYHESLSLTEALMNYRHQRIYRRLRNLARQGVAEQVTIVEGHSFDPEVVAAVHRALDADQVGLLILDADANCKRDIDRYGSKLMDGCWLIIDDYGGPADNSKVLPTK